MALRDFRHLIAYAGSQGSGFRSLPFFCDHVEQGWRQPLEVEERLAAASRRGRPALTFDVLRGIEAGATTEEELATLSSATQPGPAK